MGGFGGDPAGPGGAPLFSGAAPSAQVFNASQIAQTLQNLVNATNAILTQLKQITPSLTQGSSQGGVTAHAGGGQANAVKLTAQFNQVTTAASAGDSVALIVSAAGANQWVFNSGANAVQVFGQGADTINGQPAATGISLPAGHAAAFFCATAGQWASVPTAP